MSIVEGVVFAAWATSARNDSKEMSVVAETGPRIISSCLTFLVRFPVFMSRSGREILTYISNNGFEACGFTVEIGGGAGLGAGSGA